MATFAPGLLENFLATDDGEPVVMLNLLRFQPDGGRERYTEYIRRMAPLVERYGMTILYAGNGLPALAAGPGQSWDAVALVRYPNRKAFTAMIADPLYAEVEPYRTAALVDGVLQPTKPFA